MFSVLKALSRSYIINSLRRYKWYRAWHRGGWFQIESSKAPNYTASQYTWLHGSDTSSVVNDFLKMDTVVQLMGGRIVAVEEYNSEGKEIYFERYIEAKKYFR